ncbi:hypothetical protein VP1G_10693 [Cytospora mali]|uniref:Uncharacterized protein n=1 Tax=Cytospora mali TaxID=578113 RepID=A0A194USG5_CYTMA|nr:hypothetical protein VP1G_10693 [Valsa mali var. pyri (nom. inval.)]
MVKDGASHPHPRQEFDQLVTLEKLELDPDLFMDTYFLNRKTTPATLSFTKFDREKVKTAADEVDTLHKHEAAFAAHKSRNHRTKAPDALPTRYTAVLRGSQRMPEWEGDLLNMITEETTGILNSKDSEKCEFDFSSTPTLFKGVPTLSLDGNAKGDYSRDPITFYTIGSA